MILKKETILKPKMEIKEEKKESKTEEKMEISKNPLISDECIDYLNYRIKQEELSSRLYLAMSMYLENVGYIGAAKAWKKDADDEMTHANWAREYLLSLGIQPITPTLEAPIQSFTGLPDVILKTYDHEVIVTKQINDLGKDAMTKGDFLLFQLVMKYQNEQIEEMDKVTNLRDRLKLFGISEVSLRMFDNELGS